ncbi:MAG: ABC transporter ATP-binding protein [Elusimicrobiota bacterium]
MSEPLLELDAVTKSFTAPGRTLEILKGLKFRLRPGETVAIQGPSGSGKSTLLGLMAGLERPTSGRLLFKGTPIQDWTEDQLSQWRRSSVGFVFQNFRLIDSLTALENVRLPLEIADVAPDAVRTRAAAALEQLGLSDRADHFPDKLSGGEQQRVAIARAYAHEPDIIFADEPTGSLDRETAGTVLDSLLSVNEAHGTALVLVTHDPTVAARMSRTLTLERGLLA